MSALGRGLDAGALERMPNDRSHSTLAQKAADGSFAAQKRATTGATRTSVAQVSRDCCADICRKRKSGSLIALSSDAHLSDVPVKVVKLKKSHFAGTQPQSCQQEADRGMPIDAGQQLTDLARPNCTRDR